MAYVYIIYIRHTRIDGGLPVSQSEVVTVRLSPELKVKLDALAASTKRSKSWLVAEAIAQYVEQEAWQSEQIEAAVLLADSPAAEWVETLESFGINRTAMHTGWGRALGQVYDQVIDSVLALQNLNPMTDQE